MKRMSRSRDKQLRTSISPMLSTNFRRGKIEEEVREEDPRVTGHEGIMIVQGGMREEETDRTIILGT